MTVAPETETEIRRLFFAEHWKVGTIACQLNVHHDVVRRVLGLLPAPPPSTSGPRPQRLDPYREFVAQQLAQYPRLRSTRLYDMIHERGYAGSVRTLRRLVARIRPAPRAEVFRGCSSSRASRPRSIGPTSARSRFLAASGRCGCS